MTASPTPRTQLSPRVLPVLYFAAAHVALALAFAAVGLRLPDPAVLHAGASFASMAIASMLGMWLTLAEPSPSTLRIAMAYGVFGLVGFLAQMVVAMEGRLLPLFAWYWAYANTGDKGRQPHGAWVDERITTDLGHARAALSSFLNDEVAEPRQIMAHPSYRFASVRTGFGSTLIERTREVTIR